MWSRPNWFHEYIIYICIISKRYYLKLGLYLVIVPGGEPAAKWAYIPPLTGGD